VTSVASPYCLGCKHLASARLDDGRGICAAYPSGIPDVIWADLADHRLPLPNDRGVHFAAKGEDDEGYVVLLFGAEPEPYEGEWPTATPTLQSGDTF
jgi:hypothetical protein